MKVSLNGKEYVCRAIQRRQLEEFTRAVPNVGRQSALTRNDRNAVIFGNVIDAFGGRTLGPWSESDVIQAHLSHGHIHHFHDVEAETRFGAWTAPRQKNAVATPSPNIGSGATSTRAIFGGAYGGGGTPWTRQMFNDKPAVYFAGSAVAGISVWMGLSRSGSANGLIQHQMWTGAGYSAGVSLTAISDIAATETEVFDQVVHKSQLLAVGTTAHGAAGNNVVSASSTGNTWASPAAAPTTIAMLEGTRFIDDGNTLWLIIQGASRRIDMAKSTDAAVTWTNYANVASGQVRSVAKYFDRTGASQLMVLTETALYYVDQTNNKLVQLQVLPFAGRAMTEWGGSLYIAMDAMHVYRYTQTETATIFEDVSPGGGEAMPSDKAFTVDTTGEVKVWPTASGIRWVWGGSGLSYLCLFYDGIGYHFIWKQASTATAVKYGARAIAFDPTTGDSLFWNTYTLAGDEVASEGVRIIQEETDPRLLSANVYETAGYVESELIAFDPVALSTTMLDVFQNTEGTQASPAVSLQTKYGINGAVATTTALAAQTSDRVSVNFGSGAGVNSTTVRFRWVFVATATVSPLVHNIEVSYVKIPAVRWAFTFEIDIRATAADSAGQRDERTIISELKTLVASTTKVTCKYAYEDSLSLLPMAPAQATEQLRGAPALNMDESDAVWTVALYEA